jgi:SNF2 family DNA or RNA helicase
MGRFGAFFYRTLRWGCVTATDPTPFQGPFRAGISLFDDQLEPLRKALLMPRVNQFIADDVGLGKAIEAGLILRELLLRWRAETLSGHRGNITQRRPASLHATELEPQMGEAWRVD